MSATDTVKEYALGLCSLVEGKKEAEKFKLLLSKVEDPLFDRLLPEFRARVYTQITSEFFRQNMYDKAMTYIDMALATFPPEPSLIEMKVKIILKKTLQEMTEISIPASQVLIKSLLKKCEDLMRFIHSLEEHESFRQPLGILYYNKALALGLLKDQELAITQLKEAEKILTLPIDRILRSRVKCGLIFLSAHPGVGLTETEDKVITALSELTPEEKSSDEFSAELQKWRLISSQEL
jgi:hypothetical protein